MAARENSLNRLLSVDVDKASEDELRGLVRRLQT